MCQTNCKLQSHCSALETHGGPRGPAQHSKHVRMDSTSLIAARQQLSPWLRTQLLSCDAGLLASSHRLEAMFWAAPHDASPATVPLLVATHHAAGSPPTTPTLRQQRARQLGGCTL